MVETGREEEKGACGRIKETKGYVKKITYTAWKQGKKINMMEISSHTGLPQFNRNIVYQCQTLDYTSELINPDLIT